jgi:hypothetical protein
VAKIRALKAARGPQVARRLALFTAGMAGFIPRLRGVRGFNLSNLNKGVLISAKKLISAYSIDVRLYF